MIHARIHIFILHIEMSICSLIHKKFLCFAIILSKKEKKIDKLEKNVKNKANRNYFSLFFPSL